MSVVFLNNTYYFRCFSLGNQREALLCLGRCARFAWPAGGATSTYPMMLLSQRVPFGQYFFGHTKMACGTLFLNFGHQILPIFSQAYMFSLTLYWRLHFGVTITSCGFCLFNCFFFSFLHEAPKPQAGVVISLRCIPQKSVSYFMLLICLI